VHINLEEVDVDGAIREAHEEATGDTRLSFLKKAGIGAGAFVSGGAALAALTPSAMAATKPGVGAPPSSFGSGDIGILNYALTLEYLEAAFYKEALDGGKITDVRLKKFLATTARDEADHVAFLKKALGSKAVATPKFDFKGTTQSQVTFAETAFALENTGVHAYTGQAFNIKTSAYLAAALSILTIEARHAGAIGVVYDKAAIDATGAFDVGYTASKVLSIVTSTGFIVS
jgi:rubrerythrin